ncbi:hypothetical protein [Acinetobacter sp. YH12129]|uniref:hypothetical protein n=1 Tax=Acinetobacter sp. YH12129 TaxID=2601114 RepID=UPI0015D25E7D|nr:hypothetical protein [Acinetobacter sp. YH12129]
MVQLIKKGGLRERANRSRSYKGSENTETTLKPNRYRDHDHAETTNVAQDPSNIAPSKDQDQTNPEQ